MGANEIVEILNVGLSLITSIAGAVFTTIFLRRNTKTEEFERIKAGKLGEVADEMLKAGEMTYIDYYKANNFLEIAKKADIYYIESQKGDITDNHKFESDDFDWFIRYFDAVGDVSDDEMQNLWAKILAGQAANKSSFSFKTIDLMRCISKQDAELFIKICSCSFKLMDGRLFLPNDNEYLKYVGIKYSDIMKLNELGLIYNDGMLELDVTISIEPSPLFINSNFVSLVSSPNGSGSFIKIEQFPFTNAGKEISGITETDTDTNNLIKYIQILSNKKRAKFTVHKITRIIDGSIECDENPISI